MTTNITKQDIQSLSQRLEDDMTGFIRDFCNLEGEDDTLLCTQTEDELKEYGMSDTDASIIIWSISEGNDTIKRVARHLFWEAK